MAKEHPILFSGQMVNAILQGRKTQTRRVIKPQPYPDERKLFGMSKAKPCNVWEPKKGTAWFDWGRGFDPMMWLDGPYHDSDLLWVRETWAHVDGEVWYAADGIDQPRQDGVKLRPSIFMPRWASRLILEITNVRVERVNDISEEDAKAEGVEFELHDMSIESRDYSCEDGWFQSWSDDASIGYTNYVPEEELARNSFRTLWDKLNAKRGYAFYEGPWVWAITFRRIDD